MAYITNPITLDASATAVTPWIDLRCPLTLNLTLSVMLVVPAGPVGALTFEVTNDVGDVELEAIRNVAPLSSAVPKVDATSAVSTLPTGALTVNGANTAMLTVVSRYTHGRFKYTRTSGSGTLTLYPYLIRI